MDLMIAGITIANEFSLIINNLRQFEGIENLKIERWFKISQVG
jgi:predicted nucleic acid-binding protein